MKRHNITPETLVNSSEYELIDEVYYSELKEFILKEVMKKSLLLRVFGIFQVVAGLFAGALVGYSLVGFISSGNGKTELITIALSIIFSLTLLVILHELIHAAAFLLLGKKDIGFGAQWKKFLFYAESNREVLDRREITIVALAPFFVVLIAGLAFFFLLPDRSVSVGGLFVVLIHFFFCAGDMAIVSYFYRQKPLDIYTFDDREGKRSFYFKRLS